jgi:putative N6-adenine-specific DNA methylase
MIEDEQTQNYRMVAKTFEGLESVLADELKELGATDIEVLKRAVAFQGDLDLMYRANYWLRSAVNILKPIASFEVEDDKDLYKKIYEIKWLNYFDLGKTFAVHATVNNHPSLTHSQYAALKVKDAIADQFRYYFNQRPDVDPKNANININIYISGKQCEVALNSSGMPLFKRGYKVEMHRAPLNEVLAAGMILLSGWDKKSHFIDPMCGSGTLLIEAALMAYNFPPQFMRKEFGFEYWSDFDPGIWRDIRRDAVNKQVDFESRIIGGDISSKNLEIARHLITNMKFHKDIELVQKDLRQHYPPDDGKKGWIVTNPPYGERLHSKDLLGLYEAIGTAFKHNFPGYTASLITSDLEAVKMIGLKPIKKTPLNNGGLLCTFNTYDLYEGSKKDKAAKAGPAAAEAKVELGPEVDNELLTDLFNDGSGMEGYDPEAKAREAEEKAERWRQQKEERKEAWKQKKDKEAEERSAKKERPAKQERESGDKRDDKRRREKGPRRELGKDYYNERYNKGKRFNKEEKSGDGEVRGDDWKAKRYARYKKRMQSSRDGDGKPDGKSTSKPDKFSKDRPKKSNYKTDNNRKSKSRYSGKKGR